MFKNGIGVSINHSAAIALLCGGSAMICGCDTYYPTGDVCGAGTELDPISNQCESVCGDGLKNSDEQCDDANEMSGDGCSVNCVLERPCNTEVQPTECPELCTPEIKCGGGKCDDSSGVPACVCEDYIGVNCETKKCEMTAGLNFTIAISSEGTVKAWGDNNFGQLADDAAADSRPSPGPIVGLPSLGNTQTLNAYPVGNHALALDSKGGVWAWGDDSNGKLGILKTEKHQVIDYKSTGTIKPPVTAIAAGTRHSLGIYDSKIYSWGAINATLGGVVFTRIAACDNFNLAMDNEGYLYSWGENNASGQLGNGTNKPEQVPKVVKFPNPTTITAMACGQSHSLALSAKREVWAWGSQLHKQLGDSTVGDAPTPVKVNFEGLSVLDDGGIVAIAAGSRHNIALDKHGNVWTWGDNSLGQLGYGSANILTSATPEKVQSPSSKDPLSNIASIDAGGHFTLALAHDGTLWAWGDNTRGQLGNGTYDKALAPKPSLFVCGDNFLK